MRKQVIKISPQNALKLAEAYNASRSAVYNALAYRSHSQRACLIREAALNSYGGVKTTELVIR